MNTWLIVLAVGLFLVVVIWLSISVCKAYTRFQKWLDDIRHMRL